MVAVKGKVLLSMIFLVRYLWDEAICDISQSTLDCGLSAPSAMKNSSSTQVEIG